MEDSMWNKCQRNALWCFLGFGFLGWRFTGRDAGAHGGRVVGDPCRGHFFSNGLNLQKGNKDADKVWRMCGPYLRDVTSYLEANFLEERMQVVEQPAAIKDERWLQHFLVDLFIIQFLWWKNRRWHQSKDIHQIKYHNKRWGRTLNMSHSVQITSACALWQAS